MHHEFRSTQWSQVIAAGSDSSPEADRALAALCEIYWYPLYAYARRREPDVHQAQDLTQAFFAELLEKNYVGAASPERGKFRAFLLTSFKHFLSKQWAKGRALKRGGGKAPVSLDFKGADSKIQFEPVDGMTAEQYFDQQWAIQLLSQILGRLQRELESKGKGELFTALKGFIIGDHSGTTYLEVAAELGISEAAAKKSASRLRQRYRELLREEIGQTVSQPQEIEEEISNLFETFDS